VYGLQFYHLIRIVVARGLILDFERYVHGLCRLPYQANARELLRVMGGNYYAVIRK